jgi:hypothetical protein
MFISKYDEAGVFFGSWLPQMSALAFMIAEVDRPVNVRAITLY